MNQRIKRAWIWMLRSGEYEQHRGELYAPPSSYDPLGLLCLLYNLMTKNGHFDKFIIHGKDVYGFEVQGYVGVNLPPEPVMYWAGLMDIRGHWLSEIQEDIINTVILLNDRGRNNEKWSFNQIADLLEREVEL